MSKVIDLDLTLANKVNKDQFNTLATKVDKNTTDIQTLQDALTWGELK
jgi:hypothetical protein